MGTDPTGFRTIGKQIRPLGLALWIELAEMFRHQGKALLQS
jgi:hypothetical protein